MAQSVEPSVEPSAGPSAGIEALAARLAKATSVQRSGRVVAVRGVAVRVTLPGVRLGDVVRIEREGGELEGEVTGFDRGEAVVLPLGPVVGVGLDDRVVPVASRFRVAAGRAVLGRVVDGLGRPLDGGPAVQGASVLVDRPASSPLERATVERPLPTGVRVIDALLTLGEGQKLGIFAGAGVGKSTLIAAIARGAQASALVVALVGERGREASEFVADGLDGATRARSAVVVATSDAPPLERVRAAEVATAYAEALRDDGERVLLVVDSLTRYARALREVALASGEAPARRGFPPSVFTALPRLVERAGARPHGSITALYTVLVEGNDLDEPVSDEAKAVLDGHIVLDRDLAERGRFPAVDLGRSVSRVFSRLANPAHRAAARRLRELVACYEAKRELVVLGGHRKGADPLFDEAVARMPAIERFLSAHDAEPDIALAVAELQRLVERPSSSSNAPR